MSTLEPLNKAYWFSRLCEINYVRLKTLIPDLDRLPAGLRACAEGVPTLHLRLLERSPYTLTLELTHCFTWEFGALLEPAVRIRVYLDARAVEVLSDHERPYVMEVLKKSNAKRVLDYKWSLNYFLAQWLEHCIASDYRFHLFETCEPVSAVIA